MIGAALEAVKAGGSVLKEGFGKAHTVSFKGKIDLVTEADHRSEKIIVNLLKRAFPGHGILAEEQCELETSSPYRWILDPLDGTTNYAHGYPFFCVSLALEYKREIVWGAVYDPIRDEMFTAESGKGSFLDKTPIRVSQNEHLSKSMLCTGFPYDVHDSPDNNLDHFEHFIRVSRAIRRDGAAALDLCYVAMGRFDGFWEMKLKPWDMAAGSLVVSEAGGTVTGFQGSSLDLDNGDILASNSLIHDEMVRILSGEI